MLKKSYFMLIPLVFFFIQACDSDFSLPPMVIFYASPDTISPGESSELSWSLQWFAAGNTYTTVSIDNGIGVVYQGSLDISGIIRVAPQGTTVYTLTATTSGFPPAQHPVTISVADAPAIRIIGENPMVLYVGATFQDPGAVAADWSGIDISDRLVVNGAVDTQQAGEYIVRYDVTDSCGRSAPTVSRTVTVVDRNQVWVHQYDNIGRLRRISGQVQ